MCEKLYNCRMLYLWVCVWAMLCATAATMLDGLKYVYKGRAAASGEKERHCVRVFHPRVMVCSTCEFGVCAAAQ